MTYKNCEIRHEKTYFRIYDEAGAQLTADSIQEAKQIIDEYIKTEWIKGEKYEAKNIRT